MGLFGRKKEEINALISQANSRDATAEVLTKLAEDKDKNVREAVAGNRNTPVEILTKLAEDKDNVKLAVARNSNTPAGVLVKMISTRKFTPSVMLDPDVPDEVLAECAKKTEYSFRKALSKNLNTPERLRWYFEREDTLKTISTYPEDVWQEKQARKNAWREKDPYSEHDKDLRRLGL